MLTRRTSIHFLVAVLLTLVRIASARAVEPYEACGLLFAGVEPECFLLLPDDGTFPGGILLENHGEFQEGAEVFVAGTLLLDAATPCIQGDGFLHENIIDDCPECGNNAIEVTETCDDGNTDNFDGCDENCIEELCGNGVIQTHLSENCDDGNTDNSDGCSSSCATEPDFQCTGEPSNCIMIIPTMSAWGVVVMALGILVGALLVMRRPTYVRQIQARASSPQHNPA